jgi:type I restriction enzyme S subunit
MEDRELPVGWEEAPIGVFCMDIEQRVPGDNEKFFYIDIGSINKDTKTITGRTELLGIDAPSRARKCVRESDVLVSMTRPNLNAVALVPPDLDGHIATTGFDVLRCPDLDCRWLFFLVRTNEFVESMSDLVQGALYPAVKSKDIRSFFIPVAPLNEQRRIAAKLDTTLAAVEACRQRLDGVADLLKGFRQTVLAAATSGELTREWRVETGAPAWTDEKASEVCTKVQSGGTPKDGFIDEPGVPFLKVYNLVGQKVDFAYKPQFVRPEAHLGPLAKSRVKPGDVVMNIVGPPLGKVAITPDDFDEWNINQAITLFRPSERIRSRWIYMLLCEGSNIRGIELQTKGSAGQVNISLTQCRGFDFPVPGVNEQDEIIARVEDICNCSGVGTARRELCPC